tara:strand:+ start:295 stop:501 length:207 start_codon:yes stop_codon:yes gene_type:complete
MKKFIILAVLVLFTNSAFAGACLMMAKDVDEKIEQVQKLRDEAMKAHENGDHTKSEELFEQALELFKS